MKKEIISAIKDDNGSMGVLLNGNGEEITVALVNVLNALSRGLPKRELVHLILQAVAKELDHQWEQEDKYKELRPACPWLRTDEGGLVFCSHGDNKLDTEGNCHCDLCPRLKE